jgi:hypothetical protein
MERVFGMATFREGQAMKYGILAATLARTDSTNSDSSGYFQRTLQAGVYDVEFSRVGYVTFVLEDHILFYDSTLSSVTLTGGISGNQSGNFGPGSFDVLDTLWVPVGQAWTLAAGTQLFFRPGVPLIVNGTLLAEGTSEDSIVLAPRIDLADSAWGGLHFTLLSESSRLEYCRIEGARGPFIPQYPLNEVVGAISSYSSSPIFEHCSIRGNYLAHYGGGAFCVGGAPEFRECEFSENAAFYGSALALFGTEAVVENCTFWDNWTATILLTGGGSPQITGCSIASNDTGISNAGSHAIIDRCVVHALTALVSSGGHPSITRTTLIGATALNSGTPLVNSSILVDAIPGDLTCLTLGADVIANVSYSVIVCASGFPVISWSSGSPAIGIKAFANANGDSCDTYYNIFLDPQFVDLAAGDYHLTAGSPCIDAGDPDLPYDPDGTVADMGAFYFDQLPVTEDGHNMLCPYELAQNYPNPFNARTRITFELAQAGEVSLDVFDITGRLVRTLANGRMAAGTHEVSLDARDLPSGVYVYRLAAGDVVEAKKMVLIK